MDSTLKLAQKSFAVLAGVALLLGVLCAPIGDAMADPPPPGGGGPTCIKCVVPCQLGVATCVLPPGFGNGGVNGQDCSASCICKDNGVDEIGNPKPTTCEIPNPIPGG